MNNFSQISPNPTEEFLKILDEHRKDCERDGRYEEARITRKRLKELRIHLETEQRQDMLVKQQIELKALDQAHKEELEELNNKWENIQIPNTINEMQLLLIEMRNRHMNELEELRNFQLNNPTAHYHASPQLIALRKKEEYIAIGGDYKEASKLKRQIKALEKTSVKKFNESLKKKMNLKILKLNERHKKESKAAYDKFNKQKDKIERQREDEHQLLIKRYANVRRDILQKYKMEEQKYNRNSAVAKMKMKEKLLKH